MKRLLLLGSLALAGAPAYAHFVAGSAPHAHAGDGWGLGVVAALTAVAAWIDRRSGR
jgi:hypothetical protein